MFDDDDDDLFAPPPRPRTRRWTLLLGFAALMSVAGVTTWYALPESVTRFASPEEAARSRFDGAVQPPPEYQELRRMARRRLHDTEVARAIELSQHRNPGVRREALQQLAAVRSGPLRWDAADAAAQALGDDDLSVRLAALGVLGELRAREHERDVRELLGSDDEPTQVAARHALERMRRPDSRGAAHR